MKKLIFIFLSIILVCSCNQKENLCVSTTIRIEPMNPFEDSKSNNIEEVKGILKSTNLTKQVLKKLSMDTSLVTINKYVRNLKVKEISKESSILKLTIEGDGKQSKDYLNMLLSLYVEQELEEKNMFTENTIDFIQDSLNVIRDSLTVIEREFRHYNSDNKILMDLEKRLSNNEEIYISLLKKREVELITAASIQSDMQIIDVGIIEKCPGESKARYIFRRIKDLLN